MSIAGEKDGIVLPWPSQEVEIDYYLNTLADEWAVVICESTPDLPNPCDVGDAAYAPVSIATGFRSVGDAEKFLKRRSYRKNTHNEWWQGFFGKARIVPSVWNSETMLAYLERTSS